MGIKKSKKVVVKTTNIKKINGILMGFVVACIATALFAWMLILQMQTATLASTITHSIATGIQYQIESLLVEQQVKLDTISNSEKVRQYYAKKLSKARAKEHIKAFFPTVKGVRLVSKNIKKRDKKSAFHIAFSDLVMLKEAKRSTVLAQASQIGSEQERIAIASTVNNNDGHLVGLILLGLKLSMLTDVIQVYDTQGSYIEVQQKTLVKGTITETNIVALAAVGKKSVRSATPDGIVEINGSRWQVAYWKMPTYTLLQTSLLALFVGVGFALLLAIISLILLSGWRISRLFRGDAIVIINLVKDMFLQSMRRDYPVRLEETKGVVDTLLATADEMRDKVVVSKAKTVSVVTDKGDLGASPMFDSPEVKEVSATTQDAAAAVQVSIPEEIFQAYDIRGIVGQTITPDIIYEMGRAIGSEAYDKGQQTVIVGRDGRNSSKALQSALVEGLRNSGRDVVDIGMMPTPLVYFATHFLETGTGVMVTGSHNPADNNGLKIMIDNKTLSGDSLKVLYTRLMDNKLLTGEGGSRHQDVSADYIDEIMGDVGIAREVTVVVDCGNGVASEVFPALLEEMGCNVICLFCETNGNFPHHHPDPSDEKNMVDLKAAVLEHKADIGIAFDADGDRLGVVSGDGEIIWPDQLLMLFAEDILSRNPGADIIYDVKCTSHLAPYISKFGGRPILAASGHSLMKAKMQETDALLAGEFSGHIFIAERWYGFDDALYAAARLLEILAADPMQREFNEIFASLPKSPSTAEIRVHLARDQHREFMQKFTQQLESASISAELIKIDGIRAEFQKGWALVRSSNTLPALSIRFEAQDESTLSEIKGQFHTLLLQVQPNLNLPF